MQISYFRSSSYNCFQICQTQYFLNYVLGWELKVGKAATKGTIVHKVLEILAKCKLAEQNNESLIKDDILGWVLIEGLHSDSFIDAIYPPIFEYYKKKEQASLDDKDQRECRRWVQKVIDDAFYDPRKLNIIYPEQKFDFEIKQDWAKLPNGQYLRIKGTIDLTIETNGNYEVVDWKTGKRRCWITEQYKTYDMLKDDFQLRLYHYAIRRLYPEIKNVLVTINYINHGGPVTVDHSDENFEIAEAKMHNQLIRIRHCNKPTRKMNGKHWFCKRVCSYGKTRTRANPQLTQCEFVTNELRQRGMATAVEKYTVEGFKVDHYEEPG
jgi:hypothetical protein